MTIRSRLTAQRRKGWLACLIGWLVFVAGMIGATMVNGWLGLLIVVGFLVFGGSVLYLLFGIRCPRCRNPLGYAIHYPQGRWFGVSEKIRFCCFCGVELDSELEE